MDWLQMLESQEMDNYLLTMFQCKFEQNLEPLA